ncbi:hypothetical protein A3A84_01045 [Candidatus Collierbacteria bacterium RIFCSPLOWO2_01_FULL_50_23]|uniref:DUF5652 domain-containing protein n=2 Tax=Candidatus Collieribacteriota TaxID=1752725 RepID=A0A1F5EQX5_9BACT|nr:MAG: hypothetical protein A3D09_01795 [Candidatus Collierbacteria bacterium RIFCSPHIGHO2_02_FULL_49_10]OGD71372.1 MAG: hypothetical protein A2703_03590 [Candidatus Collierbacteria bacterium RIFCSPHIGHO2_01_FULL_50_25]OGD74039.1 MAG: hypothetical protein A3A84_01045 [Candidatus Collierbacteria bacterium RIFCSPLOWO2_01_FULL_50_23]
MEKYSLFLASQANQPYFYILLLADLVLRGFALWRSARKEQKVWFIALLLVNSMGILPLVYLFLNREKATTKKTTKKIAHKSRKG